MKNVILTGATGFLGYALLLDLIKNGVSVTVLYRKSSRRRVQIGELDNITAVECDLDYADDLVLDGVYDTFYHLAWEGGRNDFDAQSDNMNRSLKCLRLASKSGCRRFICTGSQAEYGEIPGSTVITEETALNPTTSYGSCKAASYYLTRDLASKLQLEHTWVRPFSVYGKHDNPNSLIPQLIEAFSAGRGFSLESDGTQIWNYLHEADAARALRLLGECALSNTAFNLAGSNNKPLREYVNTLRLAINPSAAVNFGSLKSKINLNVSIEKIRQATGWHPEISFK